jgi:hypothetical protein
MSGPAGHRSSRVAPANITIVMEATYLSITILGHLTGLPATGTVGSIGPYLSPSTEVGPRLGWRAGRKPLAGVIFGELRDAGNEPQVDRAASDDLFLPPSNVKQLAPKSDSKHEYVILLCDGTRGGSTWQISLRT